MYLHIQLHMYAYLLNSLSTNCFLKKPYTYTKEKILYIFIDAFRIQNLYGRQGSLKAKIVIFRFYNNKASYNIYYRSTLEIC